MGFTIRVKGPWTQAETTAQPSRKRANSWNSPAALMRSRKSADRFHIDRSEQKIA